jgi:hypothetical protein
MDSPLAGGQSSPLRGSTNFASVTQLARRRGDGRNEGPGTPKPGTPSSAGAHGAFDWAVLERENADARGLEGEAGDRTGEGDVAPTGLHRAASEMAGGGALPCVVVWLSLNEL